MIKFIMSSVIMVNVVALNVVAPFLPRFSVRLFFITAAADVDVATLQKRSSSVTDGDQNKLERMSKEASLKGKA